MYLAQNPKVIKDAATRYGISEETVKKVLSGKYSEEEKIGTKNGTISYELGLFYRRYRHQQQRPYQITL